MLVEEVEEVSESLIALGDEPEMEVEEIAQPLVVPEMATEEVAEGVMKSTVVPLTVAPEGERVGEPHTANGTVTP